MLNSINNILLEEMTPEKANLFAKRIYETIINIETREFKKKTTSFGCLFKIIRVVWAIPFFHTEIPTN